MSLPSEDTSRLDRSLEDARARWAADPAAHAKVDQHVTAIRQKLAQMGSTECVTRSTALALLLGMDFTMLQLEQHLDDAGGCLKGHVDHLHEIALGLLDEVSR